MFSQIKKSRRSLIKHLIYIVTRSLNTSIIITWSAESHFKDSPAPIPAYRKIHLLKYYVFLLDSYRIEVKTTSSLSQQNSSQKRGRKLDKLLLFLYDSLSFRNAMHDDKIWVLMMFPSCCWRQLLCAFWLEWET